MSASLVGSEMCIRDRSQTRELQSATRKSAIRAIVRCWHARAKLMCFSTPVSYTHLTLPTICSV
eukprot:6367505-Alexandrium_andersonii.AAC.1